MSIPIECFSCGKRYSMPERLAGDLVPCHDCGADIQVPGESSSVARVSMLDPLVIGGVVSSIVVVVLLVWMLSGGESHGPDVVVAATGGRNPFSQQGVDLPPEALADVSTGTGSVIPVRTATGRSRPETSGEPRPSDDLPKGKVIALPEKAVAWNWQPEKVAWTPGEMSDAPLRVWLGPGEPYDVRILPGGREVIVLRTVIRRTAYEAGGLVDNPGPQASVYDLMTGELLREFDVPYQVGPAQRFPKPDKINFVRDDGLVAGSSRDRESGTQVYWSLVDGRRLDSADAHVEPLGDTRAATSPQFELTFEEFDEESHLKCTNSDGELQWVIVSPESKPLDKFDPVRVAGIMGLSGRSPDGSFALLNCSNFLRVLEISTGQVVADLPIDGAIYQHENLMPVFRPDGLALAVFVDQIYTDSLVLWDLTTGREVTTFRIDESHDQYCWYDSTHLIARKFRSQVVRLLDLERHCLTWEIETPGDVLMRPGLLWSHRSRYATRHLSLLNVLRPVKDAIRKVEQAMPEPLPIVVGPGTPVRLEIGSLSDFEHFRDDLLRLLTARIQNSGMIVSANGRVTLKASIENLSSTQKEIKLRWFGVRDDAGRPKTTNVTVNKLKCLLALVDGTGASIAGADHEFTDDISRFGSVSVFQDADAEIAKKKGRDRHFPSGVSVQPRAAAGHLSSAPLRRENPVHASGTPGPGGHD